jgi:hypothetical protein
MTSYVFDETLLGKASVVMATDVDLRAFGFKQEEGRSVDSLEYLLVVAHRESGEYFRYDEKVQMKLLPATRDKVFLSWYTIAKDFELPPGGYQAKMVVRDRNTGRLGTVVHEFEVPALEGLRVSTPWLWDQPSGDAAGAKPVMLARRTFPPDCMLFSQFEVYGAKKDKASGMPRVTAGYQVKAIGSDTPLTLVAPTPITPTSLGRVSRIVGTPLLGVAPGEYELVLSLRDELAGKSVELREPFTVQAPAAPATP